GASPRVPGREPDDSSCRLSRSPSSYKASFRTIFCRAGLMMICGGCEATELLRSDPGAERAPSQLGGCVPRALGAPQCRCWPSQVFPAPSSAPGPFGTEVLCAVSAGKAWKGPHCRPGSRLGQEPGPEQSFPCSRLSGSELLASCHPPGGQGLELAEDRLGVGCGDCHQERPLVPLPGTCAQLPSIAVSCGPGPLPQLDSWLAFPRGAAAHAVAPCPALPGQAGSGGQLGLRRQERKAADRPDTLSSLSTGWLGPFWSHSGAWAGAPEGSAWGSRGLAPHGALLAWEM
ncbi:unnamed protein product, partial [Gulo gulo]